MIWTYKILNRLVRIDPDELFVPGRIDHHTRGHDQTIFKQHALKLTRRNAFSQRIVKDWNELPSEVVNASSLNEFKNKLDEYWQDQKYETLE